MPELPEISSEVWTALALLSGLMFVGGIVSIPWMLALIPRDYFLTHETYLSRWKTRRPLLRLLILILRNFVGLILFLMGAIMLITPGQGLLMMLLGLACSTFPGKRQLEMKILRQRGVLDSINWLRYKVNREPLQIPTEENSPDKPAAAPKNKT